MKLICTIFLFAFAGISGKAQYTKLLDFNFTNGAEPKGGLITDGTFLYGMTSRGGLIGEGVIFKINPDGTGYTVLNNFNGDSSGGWPEGSLFSDGTFLYGTTSAGGSNNYTIFGTFFKIKSDGSDFAKLLSFSGANGKRPRSTPVSDGTFLYATTSSGGANDYGTIFKIKPDGTGYAKLLDFNHANGRYPLGTLFFDGTFLYGTTYYGGTSANCENGCGVLYKIKPDGTGHSILIDFNYFQNGGGPSRSLVSDGTFLYGMTANGGNCGIYYEGCGTLFKIKPDGSGYTKLLDFNGTNGLNPHSSLIFDGSFLYGVTGAGGTSDSCIDGCGVLFKIKPDGSNYVKLHDFDKTDGSYPSGSLLLNNGCLYGVAGAGGTNAYCSAGCGVIFRYCLSNGIDENNVGYDLNIFPNPFSVSTTLSIRYSESYLNNVILEMYNCVGQMVKQVENIYGNTIILQRDHLASGLYFIRLLSENKTIATDKLIIVNK